MRGGDGEVVQVRAIKNDEGNQNPHFVFRTGKTPSSPALGGRAATVFRYVDPNQAELKSVKCT